MKLTAENRAYACDFFHRHIKEDSLLYGERQAIHIALSALAVDPEELRPKGEWKYKWDAERDPKRLFVRIVCSECNLHTGQRSNYCPNCGAKMGDKDE